MAKKHNEYMKKGDRVVVHSYGEKPVVGMRVSFHTEAGVLSSDMCESGSRKYFAELYDFHKHMELVTEEPDAQKPTSSVEQKSGGTLGGRKGVNKLTGVNSNKRKAEDKSSTPTKQMKVSKSEKSPTSYWKNVDKIREQEAIMLQIQKQVNGRRRTVRLPRNITYDGTNTRHAVEGVNRKGVTSPLRSPTNLSRSISWQTEEDMQTLRELNCIGC